MTKKIILVVISVLLIFTSCDTTPENNNVESTTGKVSITMGNDSAYRTVKPEEFIEADTYKAELTPEKGEGKSYSSSAAKGEAITFDSVLVGSYKVSVTGYTNGQKTAEGSSNLSVSANTTNTTTVHLSAVSDEGTGSISIDIDWSEAVKDEGYFRDMWSEGPFTLAFYKREQTGDSTYTDTLLGSQTAVNGATHYTFKADDIAVSKGFIGFFKILSGDELVMELGFCSFQIYAGQISLVDENDSETFKVTQSNAPQSADKVNAELTYGTADPETELTLTITARGTKGNALFRSVNAVLYETSTGDKVAEALIDTVSLLKDEEDTVSYTFTSLTSGKKYTAFLTGTTTRGKETETTSVSGSTKVLVTGLTVSGEIPDGTLSYDDKLTFTSSVTPSNASIKDVVWSVSDESILNYTQINNSVIIYGKKPGKASISVSSLDALKDGTYAGKDLGEVKVILATPEASVTTEVSDETSQTYVSVEWSTVPYADNYEVWRSVDGEESVLLDTVKDKTTYKDEDITAGSSYSYSVKAKSTADESGEYDSKMSALTDAFTPLKPTITLVQPTLENLKLQIVDGKDTVPSDITVTPEEPVTLKIPQKIEGAETLEWYVNGIFVNTGVSVELKSAMKQVEGMDSDANTLTLAAVTKDGTRYSKSIYFRVVAVKDTGVKEFSIKEYVPTTEKDISIKTTVLPVDATIKTLNYSSSNPDVADVDKDGNVTVKGYGTTTFTVTSVSGFTTSKTVTFYNPITDSTIMSLVTNWLKGEINSANTKFGGDWWPGETPNEYSNTGIEISSPENAKQSSGKIKISNKSLSSQTMGTIVISTTADIRLWAEDDDGFWTQGYLGTDPLRYVGYGNSGAIRVTLPYNQGTAEITITSQIDVYKKNSGQYTLTLPDGSKHTYSYSQYPLW